MFWAISLHTLGVQVGRRFVGSYVKVHRILQLRTKVFEENLKAIKSGVKRYRGYEGPTLRVCLRTPCWEPMAGGGLVLNQSPRQVGSLQVTSLR